MKTWTWLVTLAVVVAAIAWRVDSPRDVREAAVAAALQTPAPAEKTQGQGKKKAAAKKSTQTPAPIVDETKWPAEGTQSLRIALGLSDREATDWSGSLTVTGARLLRLRTWRPDDAAEVDAQQGRWKLHSWSGPVPSQRAFDVHLPDRPRPFIQPGLLVDLAAGVEAGAKLTIATAQGNFTVDLDQLKRQGRIEYLNGRAAAEQAVFARSAAGGTVGVAWHDFPSIAVSPQNADDVWLAYQTYRRSESGDRLFVRRRERGAWQAPEALTPAGGDLYRTALEFAGDGSLWVVWSAQQDGNWDLFGRQRAADRWGEVVRLTDAPQPDMHHQLVRASDGSLWLVWQGFRNGQSEILARRCQAGRWEKETLVSDSPANDWEPAAAAHPSGGIAVAWDSYAHGQYDIFCRLVGGEGADLQRGVVRVTGAQTLEARPTIACDRAGRLWIAYDSAGTDWGKDTGFWLEFNRRPQGDRLYESRAIEMAMVDPRSGKVFAAPAEPDVPLNLTTYDHVEYPQLLTDRQGRLWMTFRWYSALSLSRRGVGRLFQWELYACRFDPARQQWTSPQLVCDSIGRLDSRCSVKASDGALWAAWASDHRDFGAAAPPDVCSVMVGTIDLASLAAGDAANASLGAARSAPASGRSETAAAEAADLARLREHAVEVGDKQYHIYRGDMHRHTQTSSDGGGDGSLLDAYRYALDAAGLDFLLVTDHNDGGREYDWWLREKSNDLFRVGESFVGLFGYERSVSYPNGHRNVFFAQRGVRPLAIQSAEQSRAEGGINSGAILYPYLRENGGICFSHTSATGMGTDWRDNDPELEPLVEIFQGDRTNYERSDAPWAALKGNVATQEGGYQPLGFVDLALKKGYRLGFQSSSDHLSTHLSYSCILAETNTREALQDAMRRRHAYAATDNILLDVRSAGIDGPQIMGDVFTCSGAPRMTVKVAGTGPLAAVIVVKDDEVVYSAKPTGSAAEFTYVDMAARPGKESYYYVRVVQQDDRLAWGSPLWITPAGK